MFGNILHVLHRFQEYFIEYVTAKENVVARQIVTIMKEEVQLEEKEQVVVLDYGKVPVAFISDYFCFCHWDATSLSSSEPTLDQNALLLCKVLLWVPTMHLYIFIHSIITFIHSDKPIEFSASCGK